MNKLKYLLILFFVSTASIAQDLGNINKKNPVKLTGSIGAQGIFYNVNGIPNRRQPFSYMLMGNLNIDVLGLLQIPVGFTYSEQERNFSQPFNQFGISPTYKGYTAHLGYRSLRWGEYSLSGYNFLMGGLEVQKKNVRVGGVFGRLNREVRPDTVGETASLAPAYKRIGYAAKVGYGNTQNYVDLVFLKAQDVGDSLSVSKYYKPIKPAENAVVNIVTAQKFLKNFNFRGEIGFSNTNFDKNAIGNTKFDEGLGILKLNSSGNAGTALTANLAFQKKTVRMELETKQTTLDFRSFGGYQYNTNFSNHHALISYGLAKGKLRLTHMVQLMNDNLNKQKSVTTNRLLPATTMDWQTGKIFGLTLQYNLVKSKQQLANAGTQANTLTPNLLDQMNHVVSIMPRLLFRSEKKQQIFMLMQNMQKNVDNNSNTKLYSENATRFTNLVYNLVFLKTGLGFNFSVFNSHIENNVLTMNTNGLNAGMNKSFRKGKLNTGLNTGYTTNSQQSNLQTQFTFSYRAKKHHSVNLNAGLLISSPKSSGSSFTEAQGRIFYLFSF